MKPLFLLSMPGPIQGGILVITVVVVIYSVAKAVMRYIEHKKDKHE